MALFMAAVLVQPARPGFDASEASYARYFASADATRIQLSAALFAVAGALLVCWLAWVWSAARDRVAASVACVCGLGFVVLFLVDITVGVAVGGLRPGSLASDPGLAVFSRDVELLLMGVAAPLVVAMLLGFAVLALRDRVLWPRWVGWLAAAAAPLYALRFFTLSTVDGPFAADGVLGLNVPVAAVGVWVVAASVTARKGLAPAS